ncbi:DUF2953 domain-containing protein [Niallia sp. Krafla_26]|uniref:DUF2953 domain-containing protein n=1 Tax=Niallia sp. Krafla_26 TaxID=3064703 RepID=UPI003D17C2D9
MKWILIGLIVLLILMLVILLSKLKITIIFTHTHDNDSFKIKFRAWFGLFRYTVDIPLIKIDNNSPSLVTEEETKAGKDQEVKSEKRSQFFVEDFLEGFKDTEKLLKHIVSLHTIIRKFLKKVSIQQFEWHTVLGTGEAALTGMLTGAVWAVKGSILGIISNYCLLKVNPTLSVHPHFQLPISQTSFRCMLQFRIGHAMFAGIKLIKFWKGGKPQFQSKLFSSLTQKKTNLV